MARHYRQTRHDREDESRGMKRYERDHRRDDRDDRRERHDELMIPREFNRIDDDDLRSHDKEREYYGPGFGHIANMPPYADLGLYPKARRYLKTDDYPDTIQEIDDDDRFNYRKVEDHRSDSMY